MTAIDALARLRLDIERDPAAGELVNLIQNQSGELGGWGWITPVTGAAMSGGAQLTYTGVASVANSFTSEASPVVVGQYVAATWTNLFAAGTGIARTRLVWLDAAGAVVSSGVQTGYQSAAGDYAIGATVVPAGATQVALRFDLYSNTSAANPTSTTRTLYLQNVTMATSPSSSALLQTRTNLVVNPSFETNASSWTASAGSTLARSTAQASVGSACGALTTAPVVVTNYVTNPQFEGGANGWAAGTNVANIQRVTGGHDGTYALQADTVGIAQGATASSYVNGPVMTGIVAGQTYWSGFLIYQEPDSATGSALLGSSRATLRWLNSSNVQVGSDVNLGDVTFSNRAWAGRTFSATAPAGATRAQLLIGLRWTNNYPNAPAASTTFRIDTVYFNDANTGYFDGDDNNTGSLQYAWSGTSRLSASTRTSVVTTMTAKTAAVSVVPGVTYAASSAFRAASTTRTASTTFEWRSSTGAVLSTTTTTHGADSASAWTRYGVAKLAPAGAASLVVSFGVTVNTFTAGEVHYIDAALVEASSTLGTYFDGSTTSTGVWTYAWSGTAHASTSRATSSNTLVDLPAAYYVSIIAEASSLVVERQELNLSTLTGTVVSASLDPSESTLLRPGRHSRLLVNVAAAGDPEDWQPIFTGRTQKANVEYRLLNPDEEKRAIITLAVVDPVTRLAQESRPDGVGNIADLPFVLEGCGVPWNVNGSGNQAPTASVVATNDQATAIDQVAITRDSSGGYAWVDRRGVLQAWDASAISSTVVDVLSEADYTTDLGISFATDRAINQVSFDAYELNPANSETAIAQYGPYRDDASVFEWKDVWEKTFTVQGLTEAEIVALANSILAANSTPVRRFDYVTLALTEETISRAALDLYDLVTVVNDRAGLDESLRIVGVTHTISATKDGTKWLLKLDFAGDGTVAPPQLIPQPSTGSGNSVTTSLAYRVGPVSVQASNPSTVVNTDASGNATVTFPTAFAGVPNVVAVMGTTLRCSLPVTPTATGFTISVTNAAGAAVASTAVRVYWHATGAA